MKKNIFILISIFLPLLLSSCKFISSLLTPNNEKEEDIGKFEIEELFYGDENTLLEKNAFVGTQPICNTIESIYMGTAGNNDEPAKLVKFDKKTKKYKVITLSTELEKNGYPDNTAYCIHSLTVAGNNLIIRAERNILMLDDQKIEIICMDKDDLSIKWRYEPEENGNIDIYAATDNPIKVWNNYILLIYKPEKESIIEEYFTFVILDMNGSVVNKREFNNLIPLDDDLCISKDKIYLHQKSEPIAVYDLYKLIDKSYTNEQCIDYFLSIGRGAHLTSNVCDGIYCYTHYWDENSKSHICAMNIVTKKVEWDYKFEDGEDCQPNAMQTKDNKLLVPADYGTIYCFDTTSGKKLWEVKISNSNIKGTCCYIDKYFVLPNYSKSSIFYINIENGKLEGRKIMSINNSYKQCFSENGYLYLTNNYSLLKIKFIPE